MKPLVAIDIDGVLFRWDEAAAQTLEEQFGYTGLVRVMESWDQLRGQVTEEHWNWLFTPEGGEATLDNEHLFYPGVPEGLHRIAAVARVSFITHRPPGAAACTARWIASHGCPFQSLHVVGGHDGNHMPKSLVQPQANIYIEDSVHNVRDFLDNTKSDVLAPRLFHNKALNELNDPKLHLYDTFTEAVEWIEGYCS